MEMDDDANDHRTIMMMIPNHPPTQCLHVIAYALAYPRVTIDTEFTTPVIIANFYDTTKYWHHQHRLAEDD